MKNFKKIMIFGTALLLVGVTAIISCEKEQLTLQHETTLPSSQPEASDKAVKCQDIKSKEEGIKTLTFMACQANAPNLAQLTNDFLIKELAKQNGVTCEGREGCPAKKTCVLTSKGNINVAPGAVLNCIGVQDPQCKDGEFKWTCTVEVAVNITLSCKCEKAAN